MVSIPNMTLTKYPNGTQIWTHGQICAIEAREAKKPNNPVEDTKVGATSKRKTFISEICMQTTIQLCTQSILSPKKTALGSMISLQAAGCSMLYPQLPMVVCVFAVWQFLAVPFWKKLPHFWGTPYSWTCFLMSTIRRRKHTVSALRELESTETSRLKRLMALLVEYGHLLLQDHFWSDPVLSYLLSLFEIWLFYQLIWIFPENPHSWQGFICLV